MRICCAILLAAMLASCSLFGGRQGVYPTVTVEQGPLQGDVENGIPVFKGIPYAAAPVGDLRWRPPQPAPSWEKLRDATRYPPHCAQYPSETLWFELKKVSEDCLTLNVHTGVQHPQRLAPVFVYVHGGGFSNGSGNIPRLNDVRMGEKDAILVTINYRLSAFGFLAHPAIAASNPDDPIGNYGLQDVVQALEWVQNNIAQFGGDPTEVTVFGESAGASIVNMLMVMPSAQGLFQRAIAQSASAGLAPDPYPDRPAGFTAPAFETGEEFVSRISFDKKEDISSDELLAAALRRKSTKELLAVLTDDDRFTPIVDGEVLPDQVGALAAAGQVANVPYLFGSNSWEASLGREIGGGFAPEVTARLVSSADKARLYPGLEGAALEDEIFGDVVIHSGNRYFARQLVEQGLPVYAYHFSYVASARQGKQPGAAHTDDIAFVFGTLQTEQDLPTISTRDNQISDLMSAYWIEFGEKGNPNDYDLPDWPRYEGDFGPLLEIGDEVIARDGLFDERMEYHIQRGSALLEQARKE